MSRGRPKRIIPIEQIARVVSVRDERQRRTNITTLARLMQVPRRTLADHLKSEPELIEQFGLVCTYGKSWMTPTLYDHYLNAGREIREAGGLPSLRTLSETLGYRRKRVERYLKQHRVLALRIGVVDDYAARVFQAGSVLISAGIPVTRVALASQAGICYAKLANVLKAHPDFVERLLIRKAAYGSVGWNKKTVLRAKMRPLTQTTVGRTRPVHFMPVFEDAFTTASTQTVVQNISTILGISMGKLLRGSVSDAVADARGIAILMGKVLDPKWSVRQICTHLHIGQGELLLASKRIREALNNPAVSLSTVVRVWLVCLAFGIRPNRLLAV